jgi:hypothetical protein
MKRVGKAGTSRRKQSDNKPSYQFVNALPTSAAESAKTRSLVRANATKYQWRTSKELSHPQVREVDDEEPQREHPSKRRHVSSISDLPLSSQAEMNLLPERNTRVYRTATLRRVRVSDDDRGEIPWDGIAFPMEWNSGPFVSCWSTTEQELEASWLERTWGPNSILGAGKMDPFNVYPSALPRETVTRLIDNSEYLRSTFSLVSPPGDALLRDRFR